MFTGLPACAGNDAACRRSTVTHPTCPLARTMTVAKLGTLPQPDRKSPRMKAAVVGEHGVEVRDVPKPEPKPNEVLLRVRASSLNRADLLVAQGHQHGAVGGIGARLGLECAGEVEAVGSEVQHVKAGDRVMGSAPGGYAEYAVTDAARVHKVPANNMTFTQ